MPLRYKIPVGQDLFIEAYQITEILSPKDYIALVDKPINLNPMAKFFTFGPSSLWPQNETNFVDNFFKMHQPVRIETGELYLVDIGDTSYKVGDYVRYNIKNDTIELFNIEEANQRLELCV